MKLSWRGALPLVGLLACVGDDPVGGDAGSDAGAPPTDAAVTPQDATTTPDTAAPPPDGSPTDDGGPTGRCDPTKEFGTPVLMADLSTAGDDTSFTMTRDELLAFVVRTRDILNTVVMQATRASSSAAFSAPTEANLAGINSGEGIHLAPRVAADGLSFYYNRQGSDGSTSFLTATRTTTASAFGSPKQVSVAAEVGVDQYLSVDGRTLYGVKFFGSALIQSPAGLPGSFMAGKETTSFAVAAPVITPDELTLYYSVGAGTDIFRTTRPDRSSAFPAGQVVGSLSSPSKDAPLHISSDNCVLVLKSDRPGGLGGFDLYMAKRPR